MGNADVAILEGDSVIDPAQAHSGPCLVPNDCTITIELTSAVEDWAMKMINPETTDWVYWSGIRSSSFQAYLCAVHSCFARMGA